MPPPTGQIPIAALERMGLWVEDPGDGGLNPSAVDSADTQLQIKTPTGEVLYNAGADNFDALYATLRAAAQGTTVQWQTSPYGLQHSLFTFRHGTLQMEEIQATISMGGEEAHQFSATTYFAQGQIVHTIATSRCGSIPAGGPCAAGDKSEAIDLTSGIDRIVQNGTTKQLAIFLPSTPSIAADGTSHTAASLHLQPHRTGWSFRIGDVPVQIHTDPTAARTNCDMLPIAVRALRAYPQRVLQMLRDFRKQAGQPARIDILTANPKTLAHDSARAHQFYRHTGLRPSPDIITTIRRLGNGYVDAETRDPFVLQIASSTLVAGMNQSAAHFYPESNTIAMYSANDLERKLVHELGHFVEAMLGETFSSQWEAATHQYLQRAMTLEGISAEDQRRLLSPNPFISPIEREKDPHLSVILERLYKAGWIPSPYSGTSPDEFFAELCKHAFTIRPLGGETRNATLRLLLQNVRDSFWQAATPIALGQNLLQAMQDKTRVTPPFHENL